MQTPGVRVSDLPSYSFVGSFGFNSDVEIHHLEKFTQLEFTDVRILENGPVRASIEATVKYGQTTITTTVSFCLSTFIMRTNYVIDIA
jgi:hypothetical protein